MKAEELLIEYKSITGEIIDLLNKDQDIDELLCKRESIIEALDKTGASREEKTKIYNNLQIKEEEQKLKTLLIEKLAETKTKIDDSHKRRNAMGGYNVFTKKGMLFGKKV